MSVQGIRFRAQEGLVVLEVCVQDSRSFSYQTETTWRDAKVEDLISVSEFCKSDASLMFDSVNRQIEKLRFDIFNRLAPPHSYREVHLTDEERYQIDALNQHQENNG